MPTKTTANRNTRGSDLLKNRFTAQDLDKLLAAGETDGAILVDCFPIGFPEPDGGWSVWQVGRDQLGTVLERLTKLEHVPVIKVFPKGLPVPDMFEVVAEAGSARRH